MKEQDLKVYGALRKDPQFIQQLVQLYHELQTAQMDFTDLELLEEAEKERTSWRFLKRSLRCWSSTSMNPSPRWPFSSIRSKKGSWKSNYRMWRSLSMASRVFCRRRGLISLLHRKGVEIVIGVYASEKPIEQALERGNLYQASVDFLLPAG